MSFVTLLFAIVTMALVLSPLTGAGAADDPLVFNATEPSRIWDTRPAFSALGPIPGGSTFTFDIVGDPVVPGPDRKTTLNCKAE